MGLSVLLPKPWTNLPTTHVDDHCKSTSICLSNNVNSISHVMLAVVDVQKLFVKRFCFSWYFFSEMRLVWIFLFIPYTAASWSWHNMIGPFQSFWKLGSSVILPLVYCAVKYWNKSRQWDLLPWQGILWGQISKIWSTNLKTVGLFYWFYRLRYRLSWKFLWL